jgi:hypothetical protein
MLQLEENAAPAPTESIAETGNPSLNDFDIPIRAKYQAHMQEEEKG